MKTTLLCAVIALSILLGFQVVEAQTATITNLKIDTVSVEDVGGDGEDIGAPTDSATSDGHRGEIDILSASLQDEETDETGMTVPIGMEDEPSTMSKADLVNTLDERGAIFIKIKDIKGETTEDTAKKPKEIVVVGSKVRSSEARVPDSFFDVDYVVSTDEDLALKAAHIAQQDENVEEVIIETEMISLSYKMPAKLFGIIPATMTTIATVKMDPEATDRIQVKLPWWHPLAQEEITIEEYREALENELAQYNESDLDLLRRQQQTLQTISNVSKMLHDTAMAIIRKIG